MSSEKRKSKYYAASEQTIWPADHPKVTQSKSKRKDTRRWCRGKVGVEHVLVIQKASWSRNFPCRMFSYRRGPNFPAAWVCRHQRACENCGKIIDHSIKVDECPDRPKP